MAFNPSNGELLAVVAVAPPNTVRIAAVDLSTGAYSFRSIEWPNGITGLKVDASGVARVLQERGDGTYLWVYNLTTHAYSGGPIPKPNEAAYAGCNDYVGLGQIGSTYITVRHCPDGSGGVQARYFNAETGVELSRGPYAFPIQGFYLGMDTSTSLYGIWVVLGPGNAPRLRLATIDPFTGTATAGPVLNVNAGTVINASIAFQPNTFNCDPTPNPTSLTFPASGNTQQVSLTADCSWSVSGIPAWLQVTPSSGSTNTTLNIQTQPNPSSTQRSATLTIGSRTIQVTQPGVSCNYSLSSPSAPFSSATGSNSVDVTAPPGCAWSVSGNPSWVSITSGASGSGNGTVNYTVQANSTPSARSATLTIGGQSYIVTQAAACQYSLNPTSANYTASGGTANVTVTTTSGCAWSIAGNPAWISLNTGSSGSGTSSISYTVQANPDPSARSATLTIGGQPFSINQDGSCQYSLAPTSAAYPASGGTASVTVTTGAGCAWSITGNPSWITLGAGSSGSGPGTANYTVQPNPGSSSRSINLTIAGQIHSVTQSGGCQLDLQPTSQNIAAGGALGQIQITASSPSCAWEATPSIGWIRITSTPTGTGNGTVSFAADPNPTATARTGTINITGLVFNILQAGNTGVCTPVLTPPAAIVSAAGGATTVAVSAACPWTVTENLDWVQVTSGTSGASNATVTLEVAPYRAGSRPRSGVLTIGASTFILSQNTVGSSCTYQLNQESVNLSAAGGSATLRVQTVAGCGWSAASNTPFLTILQGVSGSLTNEVVFTAPPNAGADRTGTLTVAGRTVRVTQAAGTSCPTTLVPSTAAFLASGGSSATLTVNTPCSWTASANAPWVRITSGNQGTTAGTISYVVDPNPDPTPRSASISVRDQTFAITQQPASCSYALDSRSLSIPASGGSASLAITTRNGCPWTIVGNPAFVTVSATSGTGRGVITFTAPANPTTAQREITLFAQNEPVLIRQAATTAFSCAVAGPQSVPTIRSQQGAELTGDVLVTCQGAATTELTADLVLTLNTNIASRVLSRDTEAIAILENGQPLQIGTNVFPGRLVANNSLRFSRLPLGTNGANAARRFRITNLRADTTPANLPATLTAEVAIQDTPVSVPVSPGSASVARPQPAFTINFGTATGNGPVTLPVTIQELLPNGFRVRLSPDQNPGTPGVTYPSESGLVDTTRLGEGVGLADTGFRLHIALRNLPATVTRIQVPVVLTSQGASAELVAQDSQGAGLSFQSGTLADLQIRNNEATVTYEITAANPAVAESLVLPLQFSGATAASVETLKTGFRGSCAPLALTTIPRCPAPDAAPPPRPSVLVSGTPVYSSALRRAPTGNFSYSLNVSLGCDDAAGCPNMIGRGNLSPGSAISSCIASNALSCTFDGRSFEIGFGSLSPGQQVQALLAADLQPEFAGRTGEVISSASSGASVAFDSDLVCIPGFAEFPNPPPTGTTGTLTVFGCGPWTISSSVPWISFSQTSGTGTASITYTITANTTGTFRQGTVSVNGSAVTLSQIPSFSGLRFVPIAPCRVADTRLAPGTFGSPAMTANQTRDFPIPSSSCGVPPSASAYSFNVTVVPQRTLSFLTIWPAGTARPNASTLNSFDGKIVANAAIIQAGTSGAVSIYVTDSTEVILDINGYFVP
ncbi:MAG: BACON domain-containing protein [Bryobacterales bacterium]|nr:BACON domain-containing protein [Bryobacterales bacterium]